MRIRFLILIFFSLFATTSCKKAGKSGVSGTVVEEGTGLPFANMKVYVQRTTKSGLDSELNPTIVASTTTDANGHFEMDYHMQLNRLYGLYCTAVPDENGKTYSAIRYEDLPTKNLTVNFALPPFAYVKVKLHKTSTLPSAYAWVVFDNSQSIDINDPGYPFDATLGVYRVKANDSLTLWWSQKYNTPPAYVQGVNKLYVNKGDTVDYLINLH